MQTGTQEECSSVQTQPSAQVPEKAVSSVRTAPCRREKATGPTVKSVLVETGEAEQLSRSFTRGCRGDKRRVRTESATPCPVCRQNLGGGTDGTSPPSDCAFNSDHRIRHTVLYVLERKAHRAKKGKGKKSTGKRMQHIFLLKGKPFISRLVIQVA